MPYSPLQSSWNKFNWAQKHLQTLDSALQRSFNPQTHSVTVKVDLQVTGSTAVAIVRAATVPLVGKECGLALGDTLQNFRAALDHLAWDLVKIGATPKPAQPKQIYFPMAGSFTNWKNRINAWLPGVPADYRAVIRRYQPYRRGPLARAMRLLRDFSDHDKHRVVMPVARRAMPQLMVTTQSSWVITSQRSLIAKPTLLNVNTPLQRIDLVRPAIGGGNCQVDVNGQFPAYPTLPGGAPAAVLLEIRNAVFQVLTEFDDLL